MLDELCYSISTYPALYALWGAVALSWLAALLTWVLRLRAARPRPSRAGKRPSALRWLSDLLLQTPIWRRRLGGLMHAGLFWGLLLAAVVVVINHYLAPRGEAWNDSDVLHLLIDAAVLLLLIGVSLAGYRRMARREVPGQPRDHLLWSLTALTVFSALLANGLLVAIAEPDWEASAFISRLLAKPFARLPLATRRGLYGICWSTLHASVWAVALVAPWCKWRHIALAPLSLATRQGVPLAPLASLDLDHEGPYGAEAPNDLTWKERLDSLACTRCGRCRDACPAQRAGRDLDPLSLLEGIDAATEQAGALALQIDEASLWECSTCMACDAACPVGISIRDLVIDLRRERVLDAAQFPAGARGVFDGLARRGNPWGLARERAITPETLGLRTLAPGDHCEVLLWLGCMAQYDPAAQTAARALLTLLQRAGVDVACLAESACCGDPARRLGNEYLWREQAQENIEALSAVRYDTLVTLCPHCLNALGNEYRELGAALEVRHAGELLIELVDAGRLHFQGVAATTLSYHDPCYLGRGLGQYEATRRLIAAVPGTTLIELREHHDEALCCGAGGGMMWLEEEGTPSLARPRATQVDKAGADRCLTACPYCRTMLDDASETPVEDLVVWLAAQVEREEA